MPEYPSHAIRVSWGLALIGCRNRTVIRDIHCSFLSSDCRSIRSTEHSSSHQRVKKLRLIQVIDDHDIVSLC